ncbi:MAG: TlyA family RNA methyltransferase [Anaerolineales bacterium]
MPKERLDILLVERGLAPSRSVAQRLVLAGEVRIGSQIALKPSQMVERDMELTIVKGLPFVSRGGEKLEYALQQFGINVQEKVCADVGASTGGFTDCLLQHGAKRIYAIDVGKGILDWKIRQDARVVVLEETNVRLVTSLAEWIDLVTIDVSFISLKVVLPIVKRWLKPDQGQVIALIKPQFEAGRPEVARGKGVIRSEEVHQRVIEEIRQSAAALGFIEKGLCESPLLGPKGNKEFFIWLMYGEEFL